MKRILFVDDNQPFRLSFSRILDKEGYEVIQAENGREGLEKYDPQTIDLVVCDLIMPEVEGLETMQKIHAANKEAKILAISGGGRVNALDYLKVAHLMGAVVTLAKPFTSEELLDAVSKHIGPGQGSAASERTLS